MRFILSLALAGLMAGAAFAQFGDDPMIGMFFSDTVFTSETTNYDTGGTAFPGYVVLLNSPVEYVGGYEVGIGFSDPSIFVLDCVGPNGWTNYGSYTNQLCGYQQPLLSGVGGDVVLCTMTLLYSGGQYVEISFGPADPSSFGGEGPGVSDGEAPDLLYLCGYTNDSGVVATLNGEGVVAARRSTFSAVKSLFD
jgi:hypothetical protein